VDRVQLSGDSPLRAADLAAAAFTHRTASYFTPTFDFAVWNIGNIWFANAILIALAVFGLVTATRGQTWLKDEVFDSATKFSL
jgi:hypothetical protein